MRRPHTTRKLVVAVGLLGLAGCLMTYPAGAVVGSCDISATLRRVDEFDRRTLRQATSADANANGYVCVQESISRSGRIGYYIVDDVAAP